MKLTDAYAAASVCTPTRVALITGRTPAETHITNWTEPKDRDNSGLKPMLPPDWNLNGLSPTPGIPHTFTGPMLPAILRDAGYKTIHVGKAHWGASGTPGADPRNLGFDVNIGGSHTGEPGSYWGSRNYGSPAKVNDVPHLEGYHGTDTFLTEALTIEANKAVGQAVAEGRPFFLHLAHYAPHYPWQMDTRFTQRYADAGLKGLDGTYAALIEGLDKSLGDVLQNLEEHGVAGNTIIIFSSDNGGENRPPATTVDENAPLRATKGTPYEGGVRVPMVVRWPGRIAAGSTSSGPVITDDLFPTLLRIKGVKQRQQYVRGIRGRDLLAEFSGSDSSLSDRTLYWHRPNSHGRTPTPEFEPFSAVRAGEWKLIFFYPGRRYELYNLQKDLGETQNVLAQNPTVAAKLSRTLNETLRRAHAQTPVDPITKVAVGLPPVLASSR